MTLLQQLVGALSNFLIDFGAIHKNLNMALVWARHFQKKLVYVFQGSCNASVRHVHINMIANSHMCQRFILSQFPLYLRK